MLQAEDHTRGSRGRRLRELLADRSTVAAGCIDTLSAKLAYEAGFDALHVTGFGVEASLLGTPDMGLVTMTELAQIVDRMAAAVPLPIICDVDTGFGEIENIERTVRQMERAGAAAIHIEDAGSPKRNPFMPNRTVLPRQEAVDRVTVACEARHDPDFVIVARCDADAVSLDELIMRCNLFLQAGADVAMPVTARLDDVMMGQLPPDEQMERHRRIVEQIDGPVLGMTVPPGYRTGDMLDLGYAMMILPMAGFLPAVQAMWQAYLAASPRGADVTTSLATPADLMTLLGVDDFIARQDRFSAPVARA
jgi:methylisocitrate lyase